MADTRRLPVAVTDVWDWQMRGACRGMDSALFFHPENERGPARVEREVRAKQICGGCLVLDRCRAHALAVHEPYGVWGGLSESERDEIVRAQDRTLRVLTTPAPRSITSERVWGHHAARWARRNGDIMRSEQHSEDHSDAGTGDTGGRPDIFPMQVSRAEDAADVAELAAAERAVARRACTPEDVEGVAEAAKARRGEDRLEGWRRRHHTDRNSHPWRQVPAVVDFTVLFGRSGR